MISKRTAFHLLFWKILPCLLICVLLAGNLPFGTRRVSAQGDTFSEPTILPTGAADSAVAWGDFDNDGRQDLIISGRGNGEMMTTTFYHNNSGTLVNEGSAGLPPLESASLAVADFNHDGYLDVAISGQSGVNLSGPIGYTAIFKNDGNDHFTLQQNLTGVFRGSLAWGDYDQDGKLDLLVTGYKTGGNGFGAVYHNTNGLFTVDPLISVPAVGDSSVAWADYDADKDLDFAVIGKTCTTCTTRYALVMQNNGNGGYIAINLAQNGLWRGSVVWIDVNNDGYLDLIMSGNAGQDSFNRIPTTLLFTYQPISGLSQVVSSGLPDAWQTSISVGDYNNDGSPDVLMNGLDTSVHFSRIYTNNNGAFSDSGVSLVSGTGASVAWGDLDGDGSLDALVTGVEDTNAVISTYLYINSPATTNTPPSTPAISSACWDGMNDVIFMWNPSSDDQTPSSALTYDLRVGSAPGLADVISPASAISNGYRRIPQMGSFYTKPNTILRNLPDGAYTWGVQAVDSAYSGSQFSSEDSFLVGTPIANDDDFWVNSSSLDIPVLDNDNHTFGSLSIINVQRPQHGTAEVNGDKIRYTPDTGWAGSESFYYYARSNSYGYCSRGVVTVHTPGIYIDPFWVQEGLPVGTEVGTITAYYNSAETFTYYLGDWATPNDNGSFKISGNKLITNEIFSFSFKNSYIVSLKAIGSNNTILYARITIQITQQPYSAPTDITLSQNSIQENMAAGSIVGKFSCADPDLPGDYCLFSLVSGNGSDDNGSFTISNLFYLSTAAVFDYETKNQYSIRVRATDSAGLYYDKIFMIYIINVSDSPPTDILLSNNTILGWQPVNTLVGTFSSIDPDPADTFRYRLVAGTGSTDNAKFNISGNQLRSSAIFNNHVKASYTIRVRSTDQTDRYFEKVFTIQILDYTPLRFFLPVIINEVH